MRALRLTIVAALPLLAPLASHADPPVYFGGRWLLTQYWIASERPGPHDRRAVPIRTRDGNVLAMSCPRFVDDLSMEGTGRTWDGRLLNWDTRRHGRACFVEVDRASYPPCAPDQQACCSGSDPHPPRARSRPEILTNSPVCMDPPSMAARRILRVVRPSTSAVGCAQRSGHQLRLLRCDRLLLGRDLRPRRVRRPGADAPDRCLHLPGNAAPLLAATTPRRDPRCERRPRVAGANA